MVKEEESIVLFLLLYLDFCTSTKKRNGNLKKQLHFVVWAWQLMHCSQYWTFKFGSQIDRTIAVLQFPENLTFWMKFMVGLFWIDCLCKKKNNKKKWIHENWEVKLCIILLLVWLFKQGDLRISVLWILYIKVYMTLHVRIL